MTINLKDLIILIFFVLGGVSLYQYLTVWAKAQEKIELLEDEKEKLINTKKELGELVAAKEDIIAEKNIKISEKQSLINDANRRIAEIKENYELVKQSLFRETNEQSVALDFKDAFGVTRIPSIRMIELPEGPGAKDMISFMVLPVHFTKALTDTKNKYDTCVATKRELQDINALKQDILTVQEEKTALYIEIGRQYKTAYDDAFQRYMKMHDDFVKTLESQRPDLLPDWLKLLAGVATGGLLCT